MRKNKLKMIYAGTGLVVTSALVLGLTLSSCVNTSTTNAYAPYAALKYNGTNDEYRYNVYRKNTEFYNTDPNLLGDENANKYVSTTTIRTKLLDISKSHVDKTLSNESNWNTIKQLYGTGSDNEYANKITKDEYYKKLTNSKIGSPYFFYGVAPTKQILDIVNIYNKLNTIDSIYSQTINLSNTILRYLSKTSFNTIIDSTNSNTVYDLNSIVSNNNFAKEIVFANAFVIGEGANIYSIWPSGLSADFSVDSNIKVPTNKNVGKEINDISEYSQNTMQGDIGSPYPISVYNNTSKEMTLPDYKISLKNIKVNYSWYKTERTGGQYTSLQELKNAITGDEAKLLEDFKIENKTINNLSYSLPITDLTFNLTPEHYEYEDPWYPGIFNSVYTGIYNVSTQYTATNNNIKFDNSYPSVLQTTINTDEKVNWRGLVTTRNDEVNAFEKYVPTSVWQTIKDLNLNELPYYLKNLQYKATTGLPFSINSQLMHFNNQTILQLINLLANPFDKDNPNSDSSLIYNNINNVNKQMALNLYAISLLSENGSITNIKENANYKKLKNDLAFNNDNVKVMNVIRNNPEYLSHFEKGTNIINELVQISKTEKGINYSFNENGIVKE